MTRRLYPHERAISSDVRLSIVDEDGTELAPIRLWVESVYSMPDSPDWGCKPDTVCYVGTRVQGDWTGAVRAGSDTDRIGTLWVEKHQAELLVYARARWGVVDTQNKTTEPA